MKCIHTYDLRSIVCYWQSSARGSARDAEVLSVSPSDICTRPVAKSTLSGCTVLVPCIKLDAKVSPFNMDNLDCAAHQSETAHCHHASPFLALASLNPWTSPKQGIRRELDQGFEQLHCATALRSWVKSSSIDPRMRQWAHCAALSAPSRALGLPSGQFGSRQIFRTCSWGDSEISWSSLSSVRVACDTPTIHVRSSLR